VLGDLSGGVVSYLAGIMNGVADGATADLGTNDGKDARSEGLWIVRQRRRDESPATRSCGRGTVTRVRPA
jgi:hypothetical protein